MMINYVINVAVICLIVSKVSTATLHFYPNISVAGCQKCGSTTVWELFRAKFGKGRGKETPFFDNYESPFTIDALEHRYAGLVRGLYF